MTSSRRGIIGRFGSIVLLTVTVGLVGVGLTTNGSRAEPPAAAPSPWARKIGYNQSIRPILSDNCFYCHGPDKNHRNGKFRLDDRDAALKGGKSGDPAIVPGKPEQSELVKRIEAKDADNLMPPPDSHKALTAAQKQLLKEWITQGAEYEPHWAYVPLKRPAVPEVKNAAWVRNPIDAFVLAQLEAKGIAPSKEAERRTLLRRVSLDLIGLPPTPAEEQAFVADPSPDAYEKQVDRLLASPHYGERMAVPWLDAVRFADTVGFHGDQNQNVFPYRDYVINAFNADKPFDQFTIEQLAGDLLPHPTTEQLVATCFNRLNMMTREGGAQPKEYLAKYAADRVRTIGVAFLGATLACCECHDHKFDPFTTRDFYSMAAFWDDVRQWGVYTTYKYTPNPDLAGFTNDHPFPPEIVVDSPYLKTRLAKLEKQIDDAVAATGEKPVAFDAWRTQCADFLKRNPSGWVTLTASAKPPAPDADGVIGFTGKAGADDVVELKLPAGSIAALKLEALPTAKNGGKVTRGSSEEAMVRLAAAVRSGKAEKKLTFFHADADAKEERYVNGYAVIGVQGGWKTLGSKDKSPQAAVYLLDAPVHVADGDVLVVSLPKNALAAVRVSVSPLALDKPIDPTLATRLQEQLAAGTNTSALRRIYLTSTAWNPTALAEVRRLQREALECRDGQSPVLVTQAIAQPKVTRILRRGNWQDEGGDVVLPATPAFLPHVTPSSGQRLTRLDLAKWLVSRDNPLTARAFTNRLWKQFFGNGLSNIVEDLGAQGEPPSHPELLDWLAVEFQQGWDVKRLVRLIVTSSTYRQDSNLRPELRDVDPANRLLASQNPRRLEAEFVRDNALAAAGLIDLDLGGPSAKPYQPAGYYANIQFPSRDYVADADEQQYRRGVYTHWQRTFLHPMLANFDAPSREDAVCTRNVSNTPQQALALLNDPTFVEAARVLAAGVMKTGTDDERIDAMYQRVLCRDAKANERASLLAFLAEQRTYYAGHPDDAKKLLHVGLSPEPKGIDGPELAAWSTVCRVVLNLHETVTRY